MGGVSLKALFGAMLPFALVALVQFYRSTVLTAGTGIERKPAAQQQQWKPQHQSDVTTRDTHTSATNRLDSLT